jgi:hypothetical protein
LTQPARVVVARQIGGHHDEFVATQARHHVAVARIIELVVHLVLLARPQRQRCCVGAQLQRPRLKWLQVAQTRRLQQPTLGQQINVDLVQRCIVDVEQPAATVARRHLKRDVQPHHVTAHAEVGPRPDRRAELGTSLQHVVKLPAAIGIGQHRDRLPGIELANLIVQLQRLGGLRPSRQPRQQQTQQAKGTVQARGHGAQGSSAKWQRT